MTRKASGFSGLVKRVVNRPKFSIYTRLTLWYTLFLGITLLTFGVAFYSLLSHLLLRQVDESLQATATQVSALLEAESDPLLVLLSGQFNLPGIDVFSSPGVYIQVLHTDGKVAIKSENLGEQELPVSKEMLRKARRGESYFHTWESRTGRLRLYVTPMLVSNRVVGIMEVGRSLREVEETLHAVVWLMILGGIVALVVAALSGGFIARQALAPIDHIAGLAERIARDKDLSKRLEGIEQQDEIGRLAATFNQMLERLEGLFHAQKNLVAEISHELRTPLTTIRGHIDLLRRGAMDDPQAREEVLATIEAEVRRLNRLLSDLTLMAQADAGVRLEMRPVELDSLLLEVYRSACLMAQGVQVVLGHEDRAVVMGDPDRLKQLLLNLVDNALKYTPPGGQVTLSLYNEGEWVRVDVSDTGMGIPEEELPYVFERFYRGKNARRKRGAGLGLAIAKWIAEAHKGYLTVESEVGRGSTFSLWLRTAG